MSHTQAAHLALTTKHGTMPVMPRAGQGLHNEAWAAVRTFRDETFPVWWASTTNLETSLPNHLTKWKDDVLTRKVGQGVRRPDREYMVYWINLACMGVVSGAILDDPVLHQQTV